MVRPLIVAAAVALLAGCASDNAQVLDPEKFMKVTGGGESSAVSTNATGEVAAPRLITPGVVITIMVEEDRSLNRQLLVPTDGAIDYPPLGRVEVAGLTTDEVAGKIKAALEKDYFQSATVHATLETGASPTGSCVIYVIGNVGRPGPLLLPPNERFTVTKAIIAAGNIAQFGNGAAVQLIRYGADGKKYKTHVNVDRIMKRGEFEKDVTVQCNDWLIVPEKLINF